MSFTVEQLEAACRKFETDFFQGKPCTGVRNMLANMIQGGVTSKRKSQEQGKHTPEQKRRKLSSLNISSTRHSLGEHVFNGGSSPTQESPAQDTSPEQSSSKQSTLPNSSDNSETSIQKPVRSAFLGQVVDLNSKQNQENMYINSLQNIYNTYRLIPFVQDVSATGRNHPDQPVEIEEINTPDDNLEGGQMTISIMRPMASSVKFLVAWYLRAEDFCASLIPQFDNFDMQDVTQGIRQMSQIIVEHEFLQQLDFPMFNSLCEKIFNSYILYQ